MRKFLTALLAAGLLSFGFSAPALAESPGVLANHVELVATAPVSGTRGNAGIAAGIRLGAKDSVALVPLANFTQVNRKYYVEPGVALTFPVAKHFDIGVAEIAKPGAKLGFETRGQYSTSVVLGLRF